MSETIYSRWRPDSGGYDYFVAPGSVNINDDLPTPELDPATKIGVPSIEAGRPVPSGARAAGSGDEAIGLVAPVDERRIVRRVRSLAGMDAPGGGMKWAIGLAAAAGLIWYIKSK